MRIGHRPVEFGEYALAVGERRVVTLTLVNRPIALQAQLITATQRCLPVEGAGDGVITVLGEVRKALTLVFLRQGDGQLLTRVALTSELRDTRNRSLAPPSVSLRAGRSIRPFQSFPPALLAEVGYVSEEPDGTIYRAPDAQLFLSPVFTAAHCLRLRTGEGAESAMVGLAFSPIGTSRGIVGISGVLWVDRESMELRRLEYNYEGLRRPLDAVGLGGTVEFTRLENGVWFENRWEIRMPRTSIRQRSEMTGEMISMEVLDAIQADGGEVLSMSTGGEVIYSGNAALEHTAVAALNATEDSLLRGIQVDSVSEASSCAGAADGANGSVFGAVRQRPARAMEGATVSAAWKEQFRVGAMHDWSWQERTMTSTSASDGFYSLCELPTDRLLTVSAAHGPRQSGRVGVRVPSESPRSRVDLWFRSEASDAVSARTTVVRVTSLSGQPIPYAVVGVNGGASRVADEDGRALIPMTLGPSARLLVRRIGYLPFEGAATADSSGIIGVTLAIAPVELRAVRITADADSPLRRSGFYERALMAQRGAYVADFVTPEDIRARGVGKVSDVLRGRRLVTIGSSREGRPRTILLGRGGCPMAVLIDGQRINLDLTPEHAVAIDELVSGLEVAGIEIYASNANAPADLVPLTGSGSCGIVAIWTGAP